MEKLNAIFKLGIKYLYRYRKRYSFLVIALVFGFAIVTFITSLKDGMYENVYYAAQSHYAGDIVAVGYDNNVKGTRHLGQKEISAILDAASDSGINAEYTVMRTIYGEKGVVYFNGNAIKQKYVIGCDWEEEGYLFDKMDFVAGQRLDFGEDGIVLSEPVAIELGAVIGDGIILEVETQHGQKNTGVFIVRGIVSDYSIFGYYKVYISRISLNRLILFDDNDCSTVGFFIEKKSASEKKRVLLQNVLQNKLQTGVLVYNREEMDNEADRPFFGLMVFLYTLPVYLSEISDLLSAMNIVTYFIYGMMLIIILVSAAVTYRLILHERAKEMGIMRSIGFYGSDLRLVLWIEVITLGIVSLLTGFIFAWILSRISSFIPFSWIPSFEIFMKNGRLSVIYLPKTVFINILLIYLALAAAVFFPSMTASKKRLTALLSGETL